MIFGEGPIIKNIAGDLNKLFLQGSRANQPINNVEGDAAADQGTVQLMADRDPVIRDISTGLGWARREVTVSGAPPLTLPNSLGKPLKAWEVGLSPYQEGTGDPAPDNVRPIHGTDKLTITTAGKNLCGINEAYGAVSGITITDGVATGLNITFLYALVYIPNYLIGKRLTWTVKVAVPATITRVYARATVNGSSIDGNDVMSGTTGITTVSFTPTSTSDYLRLTYGTGTDNITVSDFQLELGSTATPYTPYISPSQTVITLPQTVYTATISEQGGESRWGEVDLGTLEWTASGNYYVSTALNDAKAPPSVNVAPNMLAEYAAVVALSPMTVSSVAIGMLSDKRLYTPTAMWDNAPIGKLVYELETPTTFAVPSVTIPTPTGTATTWATAEDGIVTNFSATYLQGE